jgi:hypothetical protein
MYYNVHLTHRQLSRRGMHKRISQSIGQCSIYPLADDRMDPAACANWSDFVCVCVGVCVVWVWGGVCVCVCVCVWPHK